MSAVSFRDEKPRADSDLQMQNQYASVLLEKLYNERQSKGDIFFLVGPSQAKIPAHRVVVAATSPVFEAMLYGHMKEGNLENIDVGDKLITPEIFETFLKYLYIGQATLTSKTVFGCKRLADMYFITPLQILAQKFLEDVLTPENTIDIFRLAPEFGDDLTAQNALNQILVKPKEIISCNRSAWHALKSSEMLFLTAQEMCIEELDLFLFVVDWVKNNTEIEKTEISQIMRNIRYPLIAAKDLGLVVRPTGLQPQDLYFAAVEYHLAPNDLEGIVEEIQRTKRGRFYVEIQEKENEQKGKDISASLVSKTKKALILGSQIETFGQGTIISSVRLPQEHIISWSVKVIQNPNASWLCFGIIEESKVLGDGDWFPSYSFCTCCDGYPKGTPRWSGNPRGSARNGDIFHCRVDLHEGRMAITGPRGLDMERSIPLLDNFVLYFTVSCAGVNIVVENLKIQTYCKERSQARLPLNKDARDC